MSLPEQRFLAVGENMPDDRWLWSEPKSWHEVNRALQDISLLLNYLGELPEARLLSYFGDTQNRISDGPSKKTVPPCASYPEFLNRLHEIASAFQTGRFTPQLAPAAEGQAPVSAVAFVYWSRDFLSAVAAPATAQSIRVTHEYILQRARSCAGFGWLRGMRQPPKPAAPHIMPVLPRYPQDVTAKMLAGKLARWVGGFEWITVVMVVLTVGVSIYALSGRLILANEKETEDVWSKMDAQIEAQEEKIFPPATLPVNEAAHLDVVALCDFMHAGAPKVQFASATTDGAVPYGGDSGEAALKKWLSPRQEHLCAERDKALLNLFVVTMHLQSWSTVVARRPGPDEPSLFSYVRPVLAAMFGVMPSSLHELAAERNGETCEQAAREQYDRAGGAQECEKVLWTMINRSRNVAESILGSITQYVLPVCYGFLGAMAASLRLIRRKVEASLLLPTDRPRLQQGAILGVLCGAVIGLFASYISSSDQAGGLGLSALALLAGYNVDGVFRFLDELSDRIFRGPTAAAAK